MRQGCQFTARQKSSPDTKHEFCHKPINARMYTTARCRFPSAVYGGLRPLVYWMDTKSILVTLHVRNPGLLSQRRGY
jgi:hypothetical protein